MADYVTLKQKVDSLAKRKWDTAAIEDRIHNLIEHGIPRKELNPKELLADKINIMNRVQRLAEENNFYLHNCAQSTALALMEEFGLGSMEIIKALTPFPSIAGTGKICGGISGSLVAFGLYFGPEKPPDAEKTKKAITHSQEFISRFQSEIGYTHCSDILEKVIIGHKINPGESDEDMALFASEGGFEKCGLPPGTGARIAAEIIIDSMN